MLQQSNFTKAVDKFNVITSIKKTELSQIKPAKTNTFDMALMLLGPVLRLNLLTLVSYVCQFKKIKSGHF